MRRFRWLFGTLFFVLGTRVSPLPAAERLTALAGHISPQIQSAAKIEAAPADELVQLSLAIRLDQDLLNQTLEQLYGRNAPPKKHFLSSSEFAQKFGFADKRQILKDFAQANGLTVDPAQDDPSSMVVKVSGPAGLMENIFHVQLNHYRGSDGKTFRANAAEPLIPDSLAPHLGAILGLNNISGLWRSNIVQFPASPGLGTPSLGGTSGVNGGMSPNDLKTVYGLTGTLLTGAGQTLALFELDGYLPADITTFEDQYLPSHILVTPVSVDGAANVCGDHLGCSEVELDIEVAAALAPGLSQILVYEGPPAAVATDLNVLDVYDKIATDNLAKTVSTSWASPEAGIDAAFFQAESVIFQRMAAQGQSMYAASGDDGAYNHTGTSISVWDPASQPFVTGVGGTQLSGTVTSPVEKTWNSCGTGKCLQNTGGSTGGGVSAIWPISISNDPDMNKDYNYQVGIPGTASQSNRNVPDVALCSGAPGYSVYITVDPLGPWDAFGGTSAAAPLWAAFTALINQEASIQGKSALGFANPVFYRLSVSTSSSLAFNDVTAGGTNGLYSAGIGYDNVTGIGSFKGDVLIGLAAGGLLTAPVTSLSNVNAFPNPWDARKQPPANITIWEGPGTENTLPASAVVKIFTLSGFWIKTLSPPINGLASWDLTNDSGHRVASGLYFYLVTTPTDKFRGTIAIIK